MTSPIVTSDAIRGLSAAVLRSALYDLSLLRDHESRVAPHHMPQTFVDAVIWLFSRDCDHELYLFTARAICARIGLKHREIVRGAWRRMSPDQRRAATRVLSLYECVDGVEKVA